MRKLHSMVGDTVNVTEKYNNGNNFYSKITTLSMDNTLNKTISNYKNGEQINTYMDMNNSKIAVLNSGGMLSFEPFGNWYERFGVNNLWGVLKVSLISSISSEKCNNKDCYKVTQRFYGTNECEFIYYIDKETGLPVRNIFQTYINGFDGDGIIEYQYDIGHVTDEIFEEPDLSEYEIQENN